MAVSLNSNALITFSEYKLLLGIDPSNVHIDEDKTLFFINHASQLIEDYCDRKFITPGNQIEEIFSGTGDTEYYVRHCRIADTPALQYRISNTWYDLDTSTYPISVDNDSGLISFVYNQTFWKGYRNWKVKYKYGWTQSALPDDLKVACAQLVRRYILLAEGKEGLESESFGDSSTSYNLSSLPKNIQFVLDKYRRKTFG
jgi:hypothetical protein